ncbi:DEAD/DEAH box helicase [Dermabacter sp. p3-SID358]|uniref:DEAD/DEAH box helicase n=1 Tax=Dermabacter sp. p3-SID358 TaxID=2916114 RepID=UPI0021A3ED02|nr:DEAD/DEAH box helicase [Dermabacter sp. p3-SID358]MCT1867443.1 DEAD/DEAH box helicase [Dermabacter sp. p3-SID358]
MASSARTPQPPFPFVPRALIEPMFGRVVVERATDYANDEHIRLPNWVTTSTGSKGELIGVVHGRGPDPYRVRVSLHRVEDDESGSEGELPLWIPVQSTCTCPVVMNCKHGAALALWSGRQAEQWSESREAEAEAEAEQPASWLETLAPLLRASDEETEDTTPLALGFDLKAEQLHKSRFSWGYESLTKEHLEAGKGVFLAIRPLRRGKRNNWIKSGLSWRTFEYRMSGRGYDPAHADALTRIFALSEADRSHTAAVEQLWINQFRSPILWEALVRAHEAGVAFVGLDNVGEVRLGQGADVGLDLSGADSLKVRALAHIDGEPRPEARMLGSNGVIDIHPGKRGTFDIEFAATPALVPMPVQRLLETRTRIDVPKSDREAFFDSALPRISRVTNVASGDGSVTMPAPKAPVLRLNVAYSGANTVELEWSWFYPSTRSRFGVYQQGGTGRDHNYEDGLLAELRELWPTVGGALPTDRAAEGTEKLSDVDTAFFTEHVLSELEAREGIDVAISGTRHTYRELDGAPSVRVRQTENPGKNDWFDLGFEVTLEGKTIPFPSLFVALAKGQSKLLLEDRTYFSLEHPAFDALRALIAEGEALAEWEPERQQISKYQVGFWEDLADAADVVEAADGWEATVGKLKNFEAIPHTPLPTGLHAELRSYQREGFEFLALLYSLGLGGILADDMGLGKTLQALTLIQHAREGVSAGEFRGNESAGPTPAGPDRPFLVMAPSSVTGVWQAEAARFTPNLRVALVNRTRRARKTELRREIEGADIVVTSYTIARIDSEEFAREQFAGLILDEAQFVKNRASRIHQSVKRLKAPFRLAITGTPMENSLGDLWAIMSIVAPGVLGPHVQFRSHFTQPIESGEHPEKMPVLRRRLRPFMLRRTKELVAKDLPEKQEQVVKVELEGAHRRIYDSVLQRERKKVLGLINDMDKNRFIVFRSITLLRMLALDPALVDDGGDKNAPSTKLQVLFERLDEVVSEGHRVLVFSQFTSFLARVAEQLRERQVAYQYLDGSTRDRADVIRDFREGNDPVFLISLKAGGFGLTLTEADYVFLLDPWWNPAAENQAIDRTHRIGQTERVMVYRLVASDTIEDKVLALQDKKRALFDSLTDGGEAFSTQITADDVKELFS